MGTMPAMDTPDPAPLAFTVYQGATFSKGWQRLLCDYEVEVRGDRLVNKLTKAAVPDTDLTPDDYTGCTARMQARAEVNSPFVLFELSTENGGITLDADGWVHLEQTDAMTAAMKYGIDASKGEWETAIGQIEVLRPGGGPRERQYVVTFTLDPESTK